MGKRYTTWMSRCHMLHAFGLVVLLIWGTIMVEWSHGQSWRAPAYAYHKLLGLVALALVVVRIAIRLCSVLPEAPRLRKSEWRRVQIGHGVLYALACLMPLSGWVMSMAAGKTPQLWGVTLGWSMRKQPDLAKLAAQCHAWCAYGLLLVISLHVLGVVVDWKLKGVNRLPRMFPGFRLKPKGQKSGRHHRQ